MISRQVERVTREDQAGIQVALFASGLAMMLMAFRLGLVAQHLVATWDTGIRVGAAGIVLACILWSGNAVAETIATDVNIVTGLDISNSISVDEIALELRGLARAIEDPRVLHAIAAGRHRRIGFAVFAWHHRQHPVVVPWTVIESQRRCAGGGTRDRSRACW